MRVSDKLALVDQIGRELQRRFGYVEIDAFLAEYAIEAPKDVSTNSKWVYSKAALKGVATETILQIAQELGIEIHGGLVSASIPPKNWKDTGLFRLFISHISKDKNKATRLKECLELYAIDGFVAHEDIHPTLEWQNEIERALYTMDAFLSVHTEGFSQSIWTQQEVGFAFGRGVKIISLRMGEDPKGFISKTQALSRRDRKAEEIAKEINSILLEDERTSAKLKAAKAANRLLINGDEVPF